MHFGPTCSHFPENSYLLANWPFCARFSNGSNSLNFEAKINCNTTRQNDLKWRKRCTGLKFDLVHFDGPQTKFIFDSLYKHPVCINCKFVKYIFCIIKCHLLHSSTIPFLLIQQLLLLLGLVRVLWGVMGLLVVRSASISNTNNSHIQCKCCPKDNI